eukprot:m.391437 g.391437  ORF g.391437 m.391437 type:complete len:129 (-) comp20080_c0_seq25:40-426(-)
MHACTHSVLADQAPDQQVPPFLTGPGSAMAVIVWFVVSASGSVILHGEQRQGQARRLCVVACKSRFVFRACRILFQLLDRCFPDHMDAKLASFLFARSKQALAMCVHAECFFLVLHRPFCGSWHSWTQ